MKIMKGLSMLTLVGLFTSAPLFAQESDPASDPATKLEQMNRIVVSLGLEEMMIEKVEEKLVENVDNNQDIPLPDAAKEDLRDILVSSFSMEEFLGEAIFPVIDRHFSVEELTVMADFMESEIGQRFMEAKKNDVEIDVMAEMADGTISREDGMQLMQVFMAIGPKIQELESGTLGEELEASMKAWGEQYFIGIVADMLHTTAEQMTEEK